MKRSAVQAPWSRPPSVERLHAMPAAVQQAANAARVPARPARRSAACELRVEAAEVVDRLVARRSEKTGMRAAVCAETVTIAFGRPKVASIAGPAAA